MAQNVTNIGNRPAPPEQMASANLPPPEVAVSRPRPRRKDWALNAIGMAAILAICYFAEETLAVILVSILIAFVLAPVSDFLARLRMPRWLSAGISVALLTAALGGATYYGFNQASHLVEELPKYTQEIRAKVARISRKAQNLEVLGNDREKGVVRVRQMTDWTDVLSRGFGSVTQVVLAASFIPFLVFFMLTWQEHARSATVGLFPLENRREVNKTVGQISGMVRSFMVGNLLIAIFIGALSTIAFGLLKIPFFYFAGFASGFLSLVPYLGVVLAMLPPLFVGVGHLSMTGVLLIVATVLTLHMVSLNVLYPKILGGRLQLNPLAVTIALLVWAWLWGAVGLVLAIPITAGMKIVFDHVEALKPFGVWLGETINGKTNGGSGEQKSH
jgi:predicted PurR-regulated permease PerM